MSTSEFYSDSEDSLSAGAIAALEAELAELEGNNDDDDLDVDSGKDDADDDEELTVESESYDYDDFDDINWDIDLDAHKTNVVPKQYQKLKISLNLPKDTIDNASDDSDDEEFPIEIDYFANKSDITPKKCQKILKTPTITLGFDPTKQRISQLQSRIEKVKINLNADTQEFPQNSFESWKEAQTYLEEQFGQIHSTLNKEQINIKKIRSNITNLECNLIDTDKEIQNLLKRKKKIEKDIKRAIKEETKLEQQFQSIKKNHGILKQMCKDVSIFCENECKMNTAIEKLFEQKSFEKFSSSDVSKLLWKMDLIKYQQIFEENQINGKLISLMNTDWTMWEQIGIKKRDCFYMTFYFEMLQIPGYCRTFSNENLNDCVVCSHNTPEKTIHLLEEYEIFIENELILKKNYCAPILIFPKSLQDLNIDFFSEQGEQIMFTLNKWRKLHQLHLKTIRKYHKQCNNK